VLQKALDFSSDTLEDEKASLRAEWLLRGKDATTLDEIIAAMQTLAAEIKAGGS